MEKTIDFQALAKGLASKGGAAMSGTIDQPDF
jgi:hypothetical protein